LSKRTSISIWDSRWI